ncbi:hypothetical protein ABW20_dc0108763 [Dactylellina cionopaga]|nr:hypothetical protein ABW20_dc0108763 [Dactylellina cionopaga]
MRSVLVVIALASTAAAATTHKVAVGGSGLVFTPASLTAEVGDTIEWDFGGGDHTVTQADFSNPCNPITNGFNSGFTGSGAAKFSIVVTSSDPIWYYCAQAGHCQAGMVGVINPPTSGDTLAAFKSAAANADTKSTPSAPFGGIISQGGSVSTAPVETTGAETTTHASTESVINTAPAGGESSTTDTAAAGGESTTETASASTKTSAAASESGVSTHHPTTGESSVAVPPVNNATYTSTTLATSESPIVTANNGSTVYPTGGSGGGSGGHGGSSGAVYTSPTASSGLPYPAPTGSGAVSLAVGLANAAVCILGAAALLL